MFSPKATAARALAAAYYFSYASVVYIITACMTDTLPNHTEVSPAEGEFNGNWRKVSSHTKKKAPCQAQQAAWKPRVEGEFDEPGRSRGSVESGW